MSALCRTVLDNGQILRGKKYHVHNAQKLRRFFDAGPVNRNALGFVFPKVHVDADFVFFFLEIGTDMCLLLVEIYDILILCAFMGLGCRTQINCL